MPHVHVPNEVSVREIQENAACLSPGRYVRFIPPKKPQNSKYETLDKLAVLRESKVKAKKNEWYYYADIGGINVATGGIKFRKLRGWQLPTPCPSLVQKGDMLVSTVRTYRKGIGYVTLDELNLVSTNAVMNICGTTEEVPGLSVPYLLAFLRSDFFVEQVWSMLNRGVYPRMDRRALDKIYIPIPGDISVIHYVSALVRAIVEKEQSIQERDADIIRLIDRELDTGQRSGSGFCYFSPTLHEILKQGRLDAAIYDREYKEKIHPVLNYKHGTQTPSQMGFVVTPGPSLEIKILRTRIDSDTYKPGFYALILPTNISEYGTMNKVPYLGTAKKLPLLQPGDIIFGESGTHRSVVLLDFEGRYTTNAHGLYARRKDGDAVKSIFFRCFFDWLYKSGIIDLLAVGGSGGHLSPAYFDDLVPIPRFPEETQAAIARLYHNPVPKPPTGPTLDGFVEWHRQRNRHLGIWELNRGMKELQATLDGVLEQIINGDKVTIALN